MAERRVINFIKLPDGETLQIGGSSGGSTYGIQGYYSTHYGIENCQYGLIDIVDSDLNIITVKGGMMLDMPGADTRVTIGSDITKQLDSATSFTLFYSSGELLEAGRVYYQLDEPSTEEEIENYFAWFNPTYGKWQFKSNDTGNVWRELVATPIADVTLNNEVITKIDYIGYRILNNDIYATLEDNQHVATEVEELAEELGSVSNKKANRSLDNLTEAGEAVLRRNTFAMFDTKILDHRLMGGEEERGWMLQGSYVYKESMYENNGYPTFYAKCVEEKSEATATETTIGGYTVTLYVHPRGHIFYDIADKATIDEIYNTYGTAWYYGVDTSAERIFLPRDDYFYLTGKAMGNGMTLGLNNGEQNFGIMTTSGASGNPVYARTEVFGQPVGSNGTTNVDVAQSYGVTTDPDKSGIVLEANKNKYLYICVGNTSVNEALTDVIDITTSENDTLPLGYSTYQADNLSSLAWLKSTGFFESGLTYVSFYNEYRTRIGEVFSGGYVRSVDDTYTDYDLVIDEANQMFRLPLLDGSEDLVGNEKVAQTFTSSGSTYTAPKNGWYVHYGVFSTTAGYILLDNTTSGIISQGYGGTNINSHVFVPVKKGDIVRVTYAYTTANELYFIPAIGNGSLYYKVANAVQHLEVVDMLHEASLCNPFFYGMYQYFQTEPNNASWLVSLGQWNSKGIYTDYYNWVLGNANEGKDYFKLSTEEYTDYDWVVNTTEETFRLPLLSGSESLAQYENSTKVTPNTDFICPDNGYIMTKGGTGDYKLIVNGVEVTRSIVGVTGDYFITNEFAVKKGDVVNSTFDYVIFYPNVGNGSLYFYVGEVLQSANLINAGRALEQLSKLQAYKMGKPNYDAGVSITLSTSDYIIPFDGVIMGGISPSGADTHITLYVNGNIALYITPRNNVSSCSYLYVPVEEGDIVKVSASVNATTKTILYPYKENK